MKKVRQIQLSALSATRLVREVVNDSSRVFFTAHARLRMRQRHIDRSQVFDVLSCGRVIEDPARQAAGDWLFKMRYVSKGDDVTVVVSLDQDEEGNLVAVVTVY